MQPSNTGQPTQLASNTRDIISNTVSRLDELINQVRSDISSVNEPKAQALFETTAEVLIGLKKAYSDYKSGGEEAWQ